MKILSQRTDNTAAASYFPYSTEESACFCSLEDLHEARKQVLRHSQCFLLVTLGHGWSTMLSVVKTSIQRTKNSSTSLSSLRIWCSDPDN
ncbi:hypothetical protein E2C01_050569 [Portunus trituberculatus]|uniref:Uncharacterized protein n=1 Tax=Portunus trituberculatus TaxID=210409 RepID=A0A5B7GGR7_PORTR|nr:hypothetical protein [Portunus trituberculatus]